MIITHHPNDEIPKIILPTSKSESNRCLIIQALANSEIKLLHLSDANDTQLMIKGLNTTEPIIDCEDAGTTYRFLLAYYTFRNEPRVITGSPRMKERPIGVLVDALNSMGANLEYLERHGYPPVKINPIKTHLNSEIRVDSTISSQYISALMLIAPMIPDGLKIKFSGDVVSKPYVILTAKLMKKFGVDCIVTSESIDIPNHPYTSGSHVIESDWSAAAFFYELATLTQKPLYLSNLKSSSDQGDIDIVSIMEKLGTRTVFHTDFIELIPSKTPSSFLYNFKDVPDLAQSVITVCAMSGIHAKLSGLESLYIKETNRVHAMITELKKLGISIQEIEHGTIQINGMLLDSNEHIKFDVYDDHRMAMALAPIASRIKSIQIEDHNVVKKSFPDFWNQLKKCGFKYD